MQNLVGSSRRSPHLLRCLLSNSLDALTFALWVVFGTCVTLLVLDVARTSIRLDRRIGKRAEMGQARRSRPGSGGRQEGGLSSAERRFTRVLGD